MSAGFKISSEVFWGTNGAVEALAARAAARFGADDPLAVFFADARDGFYTGIILVLEPWLRDAAGRRRFLEILDAATEQLLREGAFTDYGRECVADEVGRLRARIAEE